MNRREPAGLKGSDFELAPGVGACRKPVFPRVLAWVSAACIGTFLFTACSAAPELDEEASKELQTRVAGARQLAVQKNFSAAVAELQQLGQQVSAAAENGQMSQERKTRIEASISKVRADLEAAMAPAHPQPAPSGPGAELPAGNDEQDQEEGAKKEAEKDQEKAKKEGEKQKDQEKDKD